MKSIDNIEKKTLEYLQKYKIENCKILIGCSGGPDSTALLYILDKYKSKRNIVLFCAYVDHGLRKKEETDKEIVLLENLCGELKTKLIVHRIKYGEIKENAALLKRSIEEEARRIRYKYLYEAKIVTGAHYIALGHTSDDNIETVIMRFFKGVNFSGLCGIPEKRDCIIRPVINSTKKEIVVYLEYRNIEYRIDKTNFETDFLRNKVRNIIIPELKNIYPGFHRAVKSLSLKMKMISDYFDKSIDPLKDWMKTGSEMYKIRVKDFNRKPDILRYQSVYKIYNLITNYDQNDKYFELPYKFLNPLKRRDEQNRIILKGYGIIMYIQRGWLFFKRNVVVNSKKGYLINVNGDCSGVINCINLQYKAVHTDKKVKDMLSLDVNKIKLPVIIRSRIPGDYIITGTGKKSLKKLFNEWEIPSSERWKIPVITNKKGILCVLGKSIGYKNKYSKNCSFYSGNCNKRDDKNRYFNIIVNKFMENVQSE